ncbi:hypothetical protein SK128_028018 [Halocaridina rubra]|uniref:Uncharacterized protein n=1 Tax=Halocaridina rubra TaxID=373956 RepID=A0AAN8WZT3_HALRR
MCKQQLHQQTKSNRKAVKSGNRREDMFREPLLVVTLLLGEGERHGRDTQEIGHGLDKEPAIGFRRLQQTHIQAKYEGGGTPAAGEEGNGGGRDGGEGISGKEEG